MGGETTAADGEIRLLAESPYLPTAPLNGSPADVFASRTEEQLCRDAIASVRCEIICLLGNGSNILFEDAGCRQSWIPRL